LSESSCLNQLQNLRQESPVALPLVKTYCNEKHGICFDNLWETHSAAHYLWHLSQPNHPLYPLLEPRSSGDALLEVFEAVDQAIEILAKAPEDAYVPCYGMATLWTSLACCFYQSYSIALVFQVWVHLESWEQRPGSQ